MMSALWTTREPVKIISFNQAYPLTNPDAPTLQSSSLLSIIVSSDRGTVVPVRDQIVGPVKGSVGVKHVT